jgi:hypothetical protein
MWPAPGLNDTRLSYPAFRSNSIGLKPDAYSGTQFTLATLVALVPDSYIDLEPDAGVARLAGIVIGIALLEPVLAAFHVFTWKSAVAAKDDTS